ncbi:MAG: hypothetical protein WC413_01190 [Candidatus Nanoarchaeia archaeon]
MVKEQEKISIIDKLLFGSNWGIRFEYLLDLSAVICFIYSFYVGGKWDVTTIYQQQAVIMEQIKYILMAIFLELGAIYLRQKNN